VRSASGTDDRVDVERRGEQDAAEGELDPVKRAALFIAMNDMVVGDPAVIPVVYRPSVSAMSRQLRATLSGWDNVLWDLRNWYRET
jgi:peptide/nickel transport system substrate-binding protein